MKSLIALVNPFYWWLLCDHDAKIWLLRQANHELPPGKELCVTVLALTAEYCMSGSVHVKDCLAERYMDISTCRSRYWEPVGRRHPSEES